VPLENGKINQDCPSEALQQLNRIVYGTSCQASKVDFDVYLDKQRIIYAQF